MSRADLRERCRSSARDHQINFHSLHCKFLPYQRRRSIWFRQTIDEVARYTNQHNCCPGAAHTSEKERGIDGGSFFKFHTQQTTSLRLQLELKTRSIGGAEAPVTLRVAARASQIKCKNRSIKQSIESLQSPWQMKRFSSLRAAPRRDQWESRLSGIINKFNILSADSIFVFAISAEFFLLFSCTRKR